MNYQRRMDVKHRRYGWGYVFLIAGSYLLVRFTSGSQIRFPSSAIADGTLLASGYTKVQLAKIQNNIAKLSLA